MNPRCPLALLAALSLSCGTRSSLAEPDVVDASRTGAFGVVFTVNRIAKDCSLGGLGDGFSFDADLTTTVAVRPDPTATIVDATGAEVATFTLDVTQTGPLAWHLINRDRTLTPADCSLCSASAGMVRVSLDLVAVGGTPGFISQGTTSHALAVSCTH